MIDQTIHINLLGNFSIKYQDSEIKYDYLSQQLTSLVGYLVVNRAEDVSIDSISSALWGPNIANPSSSVKNLVYRLRKSLQNKDFPIAKELIMSFNGSYTINNSLELIVDTELIDSYYTASKKEDDENKKIELYENIIELFKGTFLSEISKSEWIIPYVNKYNKICFDVAYKLLDYYKEHDKYEKILETAQKILDIDEFEEVPHRFIMYTYFKQGQGRKAINYYSTLREKFYEKLGIELSDKTTELYDKISQCVNTNNIDIKTLKTDLTKDDSKEKSPLYCEYEVFRRIYQFISRSIERTGYSVFMALITVTPTDDSEDLSPKIKEKGMQKLEEVIKSSLRSSDIFTRCSPNQYAVILSLINYENGLKVMERIDKKFRNEYHTRKIHLVSGLTPIEPPQA